MSTVDLGLIFSGIGALAIVIVMAFIRWLRGPEMIAFDPPLWLPWAKDMKRNEGAELVIQYKRIDKLDAGYKVVRRGWLRREVHADRKGEGSYALLMVKRK